MKVKDKHDLEKILRTPRLTQAEAREAMVLMRMQIEHYKKSETDLPSSTPKTADSYKNLHMYCDWCVHEELDRNQQGFDVLKGMADILAHEMTSNHEHLSDQAAMTKKFEKINALLINSLKSEIDTFFKTNGISPELNLTSSPYRWNYFLSRLIDAIAERPIRLPDPPNTRREKETHDYIEEKFKNTFVRLIRSIEYKPIIRHLGNTLQAAVLWNVTTVVRDGFPGFSPNLTLVGPLPIAYTPIFSSPTSSAIK